MSMLGHGRTLGHGIDLVETSRIASVFQKHGQRFLDRVLTPAEQQRANQFADPITFISGRWAAKESILKVIGTGWRGQIAWTDMEILPDKLGQPIVTLSGETARIAEQLGIVRILLSITHTKRHAAASAIGVGR
jgi:holo-[acyl-carrier protein] synthase